MTLSTEQAVCLLDTLWNKRDLESVQKQIAPSAMAHSVSGQVVPAEEFLSRIYEPYCTAFPDLKLDFERVLIQDDEAVVRWRAHGTHLGPGFGLEPTGKKVEFHGMTWFVFQDGKVINGFDSWDRLALFDQLNDSGETIAMSMLPP